MSRLYNVNSICLRYVVPFLFEGSFEDAFDKVETKKIMKGKEKNEAAKWLKKEQLDDVEWLPADVTIIKTIKTEF